ncbi:FecR family protein [Halotalea alkalilenta]|uniref:FecR family protein n=1 Tax=Halotalea alkalilenta TaxID=376489 RepID=UPI0005BCE5B8|nr:FecR domain-containing protein [Halotalea alkalilenta]
MSAMNTGGEREEAALEQALGWMVRLSSGSADAQAFEECLRWRRSDPLHERVWQRLAAIDGELGNDRLDAGATNAALDGLERARKRRMLLKGGAALAMLGVAGDGWSPPSWQRLWADQRTGRAPRALSLPDGSRLMLGPRSAIDLRFDDRRRQVRLLDGAVMVETAADPRARPFEVISQDGALRPLGTRFWVTRWDDDSKTRLDVEEGAVEVSARFGGERRVIEAGQGARFDAFGALSLEALDPQAIAWTEGRIEAQNRRLDDFLRELARYQPGHLGCDADAAELRLTGSFPVSDPERVLEAIARALPVRLERLTRYWTRLVAVPSNAG